MNIQSWPCFMTMLSVVLVINTNKCFILLHQLELHHINDIEMSNITQTSYTSFYSMNGSFWIDKVPITDRRRRVEYKNQLDVSTCRQCMDHVSVLSPILHLKNTQKNSNVLIFLKLSQNKLHIDSLWHKKELDLLADYE